LGASGRNASVAPRRIGERFRVVAVVPLDDEDKSPFVGLLQIEAG
jgi:hypothetical protein